MSRRLQYLEDSGREIGEWAFRRHVTTRSYQDDITARAKELGLTLAVSGDVNPVVRCAAMERLSELLDEGV